MLPVKRENYRSSATHNASALDGLVITKLSREKKQEADLFAPPKPGATADVSHTAFNPVTTRPFKGT